MRYFRKTTGEYIGGFDAGSMGLVPGDAVEIQEPPEHGADVWNGAEWDKSGRPSRLDTDPQGAAVEKLLDVVKAQFPEKAAELQPFIDAVSQGKK